MAASLSVNFPMSLCGPRVTPSLPSSVSIRSVASGRVSDWREVIRQAATFPMRGQRAECTTKKDGVRKDTSRISERTRTGRLPESHATGTGVQREKERGTRRSGARIVRGITCHGPPTGKLHSADDACGVPDPRQERDQSERRIRSCLAWGALQHWRLDSDTAVACLGGPSPPKTAHV